MLGDETIYGQQGLREIADFWSNDDNPFDYEDRVEAVMLGLTGQGESALNEGTILGDGSIDQMTGGGGEDWFWVEDGIDQIVDQDFDEIVSLF